jgi:SAM-dependent methyltransferase
MESWLPDELRYAGPEHLDAEFVAGYDRKQGWPDPAPDVEALRAAGVLGPHATVVDLGTGTGRFARAVAPHCGRVVAVDVSAPMLAHLRAALAGLSTVELVRGGFLTYRHQGPPADAVHTRNALHQLPDFFKGIALARIAAILRPGGILRLRDLVYDDRPGLVQASGGGRRSVRVAQHRCRGPCLPRQVRAPFRPRAAGRGRPTLACADRRCG